MLIKQEKISLINKKDLTVNLSLYALLINILRCVHYKDSRIQGFKSIYLQQPIHFATVLINKTYSTITRQIEITNNH